MPQDGSKRKLAAILNADVKGYSLLLADDEAFTIKMLKDYRGIMSNCIEQHNGRVVDSPGDNLLAEFSSAVDAVQCAVGIQKQLKKENERLAEKKRLEFRIGINIGDVVQDGNRIYGSGVNVAARIEGLADPGGICISRNTYDHVKDTLDLGFEYLGEHEVKNIKDPVRVYRILMDADSPKPLVEEQLELPDKPSIAVLPFDNMSGDPSQEYFSDGLTEQIINGLCKVSNLFVIARNSSFAYKGKSISIKQIAKELGVQYILEGSVQRAGDRVRITAQLIDAMTDYHMWSENYDRDLSDIFALQDEITMKLCLTMMVNLTHGEQARLWGNATTLPKIEAYEKLMQGHHALSFWTKQDNAQAIIFFEEAISLDKSFVLAHASLGMAHLNQLVLGWNWSPSESFQRVEKCALKAIELDDKLDLSHLLLANVYLFKRQHADAIKEGEKALALNPNGAEAHAGLSSLCNYNGEAKRAIKLINRAIRLNPFPPPWYYATLGAAHRLCGNYNEAVKVCKKIVGLVPDFIVPYISLTASYVALGKTAKAHEAVQEVLRINPMYSVETVTTIPYKNKADINTLIEAFRKAGLPEHSPE